jgi:N-formylglutamate amidohydrolase
VNTKNNFEQKDFVLTVRNDSPVIITVPHDGVLPKEYFRNMFLERIPDSGRDIQIVRDVYVFPIVKDILLDVPVNVVYTMLHRAYIDFNRPADIGIGDERLKYVYDHYHATIAKLIRWCKKKYGYCLLLDFHGCANLAKPGMENIDIILGTNNHKSVFSDVDEKFVYWLTKKGYGVLVANDDIFPGLAGYNVADYAKEFHIDAMLLEITRRFRTKGVEIISKTLAEDIAEFIHEYVSNK